MSTSDRELLRRRILKQTDCWWTVAFVDPLAIRLLPPLARRPWVTPFRLTATAALLGVVSGVLFATGHVVLAAVCFEARFFVDCLDGKLARLRGVSSPRGAFFDLGCDLVLVSGNLAALGWHLANRNDVPLALPLVVVNLCVVSFWFLLYRDLKVPAARPEPEATGAGERGIKSRVGEWFDRHRLVRSPHMVEFETLALFLMPLTGRTSLIVAGLVLAGIYYLLASARLVAVIYRSVPAVTEA